MKVDISDSENPFTNLNKVDKYRSERKNKEKVALFISEILFVLRNKEGHPHFLY